MRSYEDLRQPSPIAGRTVIYVMTKKRRSEDPLFKVFVLLLKPKLSGKLFGIHLYRR